MNQVWLLCVLPQQILGQSEMGRPIHEAKAVCLTNARIWQERMSNQT